MRVIQDALTGIIRPASVQQALRNLNGAAGYIRKHVSSTGNRNWYELTEKAIIGYNPVDKDRGL